MGGLEKGHPLSSEGVCHGVAPSFSWSSSRSPAGVLGVVCPEGGLVYRHTLGLSLAENTAPRWLACGWL